MRAGQAKSFQGVKDRVMRGLGARPKEEVEAE